MKPADCLTGPAPDSGSPPPSASFNLLSLSLLQVQKRAEGSVWAGEGVSGLVGEVDIDVFCIPR